jgi:N-acetylneuraminate synthase
MNVPAPTLAIGPHAVGPGHPTYFIADIAANHDGDAERARRLIALAAKAGAQAAKFQHFTAETIVSDHGFRSLGRQQSHQAGWGKSVFEVYRDASLDAGWTPMLKRTCDEHGITFMTSPYSFALVDLVDPYVPAYKVGSGDITWHAIIRHMAAKGKPVLIATGAASADEVVGAIDAALALNPAIALMQCNTNYTGSVDNFRHVHLRVLETYRLMYPGMVLGFSDHTPGHSAVLGAVALGARVVEKHFTDDRGRTGPDHGFSLDPAGWREMVERTRELESALGSGIKFVADNERETVVLQRRAIRAARDLPAGTVLVAADVEALRPCPVDGLPPSALDLVVGRRLRGALGRGAHLTRGMLDDAGAPAPR